MKDPLTLRIRLGDELAFELVFRKYYSRLCGFANKYLNNPTEAAEVAQEVFIKLWERKEDIYPDESLVPYLFKITQNNCINRLRHKKIESRYAEIYKIVYVDNREITPYESLLSKEIYDKIPIAISKIPPKCRRIFELSRIEGLKYIEIAELLNISVKTVETQMSKALQILRQGLSEYLE